jgi:hypothetical protein
MMIAEKDVVWELVHLRCARITLKKEKSAQLVQRLDVDANQD